MSQNMVIFGGTGFVGRHICAALNEDVTVVGRSRPHDLPMGAKFVAMDVARSGPESIAELLRAESPRTVVNAAGEVWGGDEERMVRSNVTLVEHLLAALAAVGGRIRLVHLGSVHEYGAIAQGTRIDEHTETVPASAYGRTKLQATNAVLDATRGGRVSGMVLRVSNVIGPGLSPVSLPGATTARLRAALGTGEPAVLTLVSRPEHRDFIDVRDLVAAVLAAGESAVEGVVNIARGESVDIRTMVDALVAISGVPTEIVTDGEPAWPVRGSDGRQRYDVTAARTLLGWTPRRNLEEMLRSLWEAALTAH
ncbi:MULTISPECIES: NAD(P)-dependent oxidoreductase [unclassified Streptomyces]|uniref:NAD-dependent epimerase/dehydratase family protein n=1 Tax=unclassified Streptomyces TaxID=2593676 RepID=UPI00119D30D8|nr:NAD(P)-dependent oxidoreductase [Streptomyces sp. BK340]